MIDHKTRTDLIIKLAEKVSDSENKVTMPMNRFQAVGNVVTNLVVASPHLNQREITEIATNLIDTLKQLQ